MVQSLETKDNGFTGRRNHQFDSDRGKGVGKEYKKIKNLTKHWYRNLLLALQ